MLEGGFKGQDFKGLFTFYREQQQIGQLQYNKIDRDEQQIIQPLTNRTNKQRQSIHKKGNISQSSAGHNTFQQKGALSHRLISNNAGVLIDRYASKQSINTVVSLNFNTLTARKNQRNYKLLICRPKRSKTQMQSRYSAHNEQLKNTLVRKKAPLIEIFTPKKQIKGRCNNKNELRLNSIMGRCVSDQDQYRQSQIQRQTGLHQAAYEAVARIQKISSGQGTLHKNNNSIFSDLLIQNRIEDRNRKRKQVAIWRDSFKTNNIDQKIQEWVQGQIMPKNQSQMTNKNPFPFYLRRRKHQT